MFELLRENATCRFKREDFKVVLRIEEKHTANTPIGVGDLIGSRGR